MEVVLIRICNWRLWTLSLFTNVSTELAIISIKKNGFYYISKTTMLTEDEFLIALRFVLKSTYFVFDNVFYKQVLEYQ